jgi:gp32 DNA binding protein like
MANLNEMDDLFSGNLDSKMDFLNEKKTVNADGIYRIDLTKVKDKKKGYRSVVRFLPNLTKDGKVGQAALEKITHYVDIKNVKELSGWFDSPKNFNEKCPLTDLYYTMTNSKNAILQEKAKCLKYSKKYYSYVLILEDDQQPETVGKIMIFQYGKTIKDKIGAERNGEITGVPCNVFDLSQGKDFVVLVKEISTGDETYPDYKNSMFKPEVSSLSIYNEEKGTFKNVPVADGKVDPRAQGMVKEFLMKRDHELEDFGAKKLTDEQQAKINEITSYLTGKASSSYNTSSNSKPSSDDFEVEGLVSSGTVAVAEDEDDFFSDFA